MLAACPHCLFEVDLPPGYGTAACPACNNLFSEAVADDPIAAEAVPDPFGGPIDEPPPPLSDAAPLADAEPVTADPPPWIGADPTAELAAMTMGVEPSVDFVLAAPSDFIGGPEGDTLAGANTVDDSPIALDSSSPADAANPLEAGAGVEDAGNFLASNSDFIGGPGEGDPGLALDDGGAAEVPAFDDNAVFYSPAPGESPSDASSAEAPPLADPNAAWDPNEAPVEAAAPAVEAADPDWVAAPPESFFDAGAPAEPSAPGEEDPYAGLPVSWENANQPLPTRPRHLPTVNEDGTLHDEAAALAMPDVPPAVVDEAAWDAASAASASEDIPAPAPRPSPPPPIAPIPPPPPPPASVGSAVPLPPSPPPANAPRPVSTGTPPARTPTITPDAPDAPSPSFAPAPVANDFRPPERPAGARERTHGEPTGTFSTPAAAAEAAAAKSAGIVVPPIAAPPPTGPRTSAKSSSAVASPPPIMAPKPRAPRKSVVGAVTPAAEAPWSPGGAAAAPAPIPKPRSRTPLFLGAAAGAFVLIVGGSFAITKFLGGGGAHPVAMPTQLAAVTETPASLPSETPVAVEPTPDATPEATTTPGVKPTPTPRVAKATPTPKVVKPTPKVTARTPLPVSTVRPVATPRPTATKLAIVATPTPKPVATSSGASFLDAPASQSSVKSKAGSRFGANPNVDMRDARYVELEKGHKMLDAWKNEAAIKQYKKIVKAHENFADGHYWYAYASALQGHTTRACSEFNRYLVLAPAGYYAKTARTQIKRCK